MLCIKCNDVLTGKEIAQGKQKCASCLVRGYKFAMGKMFKEIEELEAKLAGPMSIQRDAIAAGRGQESKKPFVLKKKLVIKEKPLKKKIVR